MLKIVISAVRDFIQDEVLTRSAALAFYTALSFAPLIIVLVWGTSFIGEGTQHGLINQLVLLTGPQVGETIDLIIENAKERPSLGALAGWISLGLLVISASGIFLELQDSLNKIWKAEATNSEGFFYWVRKRLLSIGMLLSLAFLMLVSMTLSAVVALFSSWLGDSAELFIELLNTGISLIVFTILFAALFRVLPDTRIEWREVWYGAFTTALLFYLGKYAIGIYLGFSAIAPAYGAAGSLVVLLLWVYYSAIIFFFGAELTKAHAKKRSTL